MKLDRTKLTDETFSIDEKDAHLGLDLNRHRRNPGEYSEKRLTN